MSSWKQKNIRQAGRVAALGLFIFISLLVPAVARAAQSSSSNYQVNEVFFGVGGELHACGTAYCAKQSAGETGAGNTASPNYQAQAGFNTDRQPFLQLVVNTTNINLGVLTAGTTTTANATFSVKSYLSNGYAVTNAGTPPTNGSYTMNTLGSPTASAAASEQFGINVVRNQTSCATPAPVNFGADPVQVPSASFSFGAAATGYNTCGLFKYVNGDTIAASTKSSGQTDFTISYIFNTTSTTRGGSYSMSHVLVATATF
jgi:hypothetical protein